MLNPHQRIPSPVMPVDMAMRICLANSPPLNSFLGNYENCCPSSTIALLPRCKPLRPCLSSRHCSENSCSTGEIITTSVPSSNGWSGKTKKVVFADSKGMALTDVHIFKETEDDPLAELQFHLTDLEGATARIRLEGEEGPEDQCPCLVLDFQQPCLDYLELRNRLKAQKVCLENCSVQEHSLSGTVKVQNISFEKSVAVRITFNSWLTFLDIPCVYLNNVYGCPETDTFSFNVSFPEVFEPSERVEFCIQYEAKNLIFWDNNNGENYCLVPANSNQTGSATGTMTLEIQRDGGRDMKVDMEFDPFGSPRTSSGIFQEWQSWGHLESTTPYCVKVRHHWKPEATRPHPN